eukprot:TRINITY_DN530_c0_g1_i1.p1 TRINITY_DN530_c0_g1~~TRINITY_DN530_c0_g1_i1.p1  ORF type:complete len:164 (+),score=38.54 TRINITY_DN530_c0_g1_i1:112-603(+)
MLKATFAAGCFWSVELVFQREPGVQSTKVGYTGGIKENPTYKEVCTGKTEHAEAVEVEYDPKVVSYERLLEIFWHKHDPTTVNRQGGDIGTQYRSAIFYHNERQRELAEKTKAEQQAQLGKTVVTQIVPAQIFYVAEEYHQKYLEKGGQCSAKGCKDAIRCYG